MLGQSKKVQEKYFREFMALLDEDLKKMTRENIFAVYGYFWAFSEMGYISLEQFKTLVDRLPLTADDTDEILL